MCFNEEVDAEKRFSCIRNIEVWLTEAQGIQEPNIFNSFQFTGNSNFTVTINNSHLVRDEPERGIFCVLPAITLFMRCQEQNRQLTSMNS
jgi:hypothetical protein